MNIKPIETIYNGYRFRSRLEARWAVFFDTLNVPYEYEPEGFVLHNGDWYLPDFRVKCYGMRTGEPKDYYFDLWIEVKGEMTESEADKIKAFAFCNEIFPVHPVLILGNIPPIGYFYNFDEWDRFLKNFPNRSIDRCVEPFSYYTIDGDIYGAFPAGLNGKFFLMGRDGDYYSDEAIAASERAYQKARFARFEYGEKG